MYATEFHRFSYVPEMFVFTVFNTRCLTEKGACEVEAGLGVETRGCNSHTAPWRGDKSQGCALALARLAKHRHHK